MFTCISVIVYHVRMPLYITTYTLFIIKTLLFTNEPITNASCLDRCATITDCVHLCVRARALYKTILTTRLSHLERETVC